MPSAFSVTRPPVTATELPAVIAVPLMAVTVSASPSASPAGPPSRSLLRTSKVTGVSSAVVTASLTATGGGLVTVKVKVWVTDRLPSEAVMATV